MTPDLWSAIREVSYSLERSGHAEAANLIRVHAILTHGKDSDTQLLEIRNEIRKLNNRCEQLETHLHNAAERLNEALTLLGRGGAGDNESG